MGTGKFTREWDREFFVAMGWGWGREYFMGTGWGKFYGDGDNFIYHVTL